MKRTLSLLFFCLFTLLILGKNANTLTIANTSDPSIFNPPCDPPVISEITVQDNFLTSGNPDGGGRWWFSIV
jgi:hypothetical protein